MTIKSPTDEHALLGALLWGRDISEVAALVRPSDFRSPPHEAIWRALLATHEAGTEVNATTVWDHLPPERQVGHRAISAAYLADLLEVAGVDPLFYAQRVVEEATWAEIGDTATRLHQAYVARAGTAEDVRQQAAGWLEQMDARFVDTHTTPGDTLPVVIDVAERGVSEALPTKWPDLDDIIGGWYPGAFVVVAARPGVGKSLVAENIATHAALKLQHPVYMASVEMSTFELTQRTVANVCGVQLSSLRRGDPLSEAEWQRIAKKTSLIQQMPVWHADVSTQTTADIRAGVRRMRRRHGRAPLVIVDYLQLLAGGEGAERRQVKIGQDTRALKRLARDEGTTVIGMAQLNRDAANRQPQISDLREAGDIEQDADVVILLHWPDENDGRMLAVVAKHRSGPTGAVELVRQGWFARVESKAFAR